MKILRNVMILLTMLALLVGCHPTGCTTADYRERSFRAEIRFVEGGVTVYAEAEVERATEGGEATLRYVRFLSPPSLEGMELVREGETIILSRDGLRMTAAGAAGWWETAALLCASGTLRYVCDTELEGLALEYAEITDGTRAVEVLREPETGIPKRIGDGERELTIIRFERIEART